MRISRKAAIIGAVPVLGLVVGGTAFAATSVAKTAPPTSLYGCINVKTRTIDHVYTVAANFPGCPSGEFAFTTGATGPAGAPGKNGTNGVNGTNGSNGTNGASAIESVSATTVLTGRPETSGWANDDFTRIATVTRESAVPASDCGSDAASCWFYTETLADNGTFTTVPNQTGPNGTGTTGSTPITGTMVGGGKVEFYADSDTPNPALVPGTVSGDSGSTTDWFEQFFPAGTQFEPGPGQAPYTDYAPWVTYDWKYTAGTQSWNDAINPGDDGQSAADGNITG